MSEIAALRLAVENLKTKVLETKELESNNRIATEKLNIELQKTGEAMTEITKQKDATRLRKEAIMAKYSFLVDKLNINAPIYELIYSITHILKMDNIKEVVNFWNAFRKEYGYKIPTFLLKFQAIKQEAGSLYMASPVPNSATCSADASRRAFMKPASA